MLNLRDIMYLEWILNRLLYKFQDDKKYIDTAKKIINKIKSPKIFIADDNLNKILSKYFIDFNLEKTEHIGYSEKDRQNLRNSIRSIVQDIIDNKFPKDHEILIK